MKNLPLLLLAALLAGGAFTVGLWHYPWTTCILFASVVLFTAWCCWREPVRRDDLEDL